MTNKSHSLWVTLSFIYIADCFCGNTKNLFYFNTCIIVFLYLYYCISLPVLLYFYTCVIVFLYLCYCISIPVLLYFYSWIIVFLYLYARIRAFRAKILNICRVVTRVQRPLTILSIFFLWKLVNFFIFF